MPNTALKRDAAKSAAPLRSGLRPNNRSRCQHSRERGRRSLIATTTCRPTPKKRCSMTSWIELMSKTPYFEPFDKLRTGSASLPAAGAGEPPREPEGPYHGQYGFGSFCLNKKPVLSHAEGALACRGETPQHKTSL